MHYVTPVQEKMWQSKEPLQLGRSVGIALLWGHNEYVQHAIHILSSIFSPWQLGLLWFSSQVEDLEPHQVLGSLLLSEHMRRFLAMY